MNRLPKKRGITQDGEDKSLTAHSKSGNSPEDKRPENLYDNLGEVVTISGMPASKEYIKALQLKRLEQVGL